MLWDVEKMKRTPRPGTFHKQETEATGAPDSSAAVSLHPPNPPCRISAGALPPLSGFLSLGPFAWPLGTLSVMCHSLHRHGPLLGLVPKAKAPSLYAQFGITVGEGGRGFREKRKKFKITEATTFERSLKRRR